MSIAVTIGGVEAAPTIVNVRVVRPRWQQFLTYAH
jgi:hypothetical protein